MITFALLVLGFVPVCSSFSTKFDEPTCDIELGQFGYNYKMVVEWPENFESVWFKVEATNDIHISLSKTHPLSTQSWELVLGGWSGTQSVIRSSHQGHHLVTVKHTRAQFDQVQTVIFNNRV